MAKLDSQNRLIVPKKLLNSSNTDFSTEVRMYIRGNEFFLDNPSKDNRFICCLGSVKIDSKGRFCVTKAMQKSLNIDQESNILCFLLDEKVTFRKIFFIPENR